MTIPQIYNREATSQIHLEEWDFLTDGRIRSIISLRVVMSVRTFCSKVTYLLSLNIYVKDILCHLKFGIEFLFCIMNI